MSHNKGAVLPHQPRDGGVIVAAVALMAIGWVMVTSASIEVISGHPYFYSIRHGVFVILAVITALITVRVPMSWWRAKGPVLYLIAIILLVAVLIVGRDINGSKRWIGFGVINLQASELAKLFMIIYLSSYMVRHLDRVRTTWQAFFLPLGVAFLLGILLMMEPDYGATVVLLSSTMGMLMLAGVALHRFVVLSAGILAVGIFVAIAEPYRVQRITSFLDPWARMYDSGYQLTQALIAFGRGGWTGMGMGNSVQKLSFLPEAHTDFVFSVLAEELGVFGSISVILLFALLVYRAFRIGRNAETSGRFFSAYVCYGCGLIFGTQAFINIAVNAGLLPTKGLTLPLLSYGGSSLLVSGVMVGLLLRVDGETRAYLAARGTQGRRSPRAVKEASA